MKTYTKEELAAVLTAHSLWLSGDTVKGQRANLSSANLSSANLRGANLWGANLRSANLSSANLSSADLSSANLRSANLWGADLSSANLRSANLSSANLSSANLSSADLSSANLRSADLSSADLSSANLRSANLSSAKNAALVQAQTSIVPEQGAFEGWKKCREGVLVRLLIPANAKRSNATGRKCRAEFVKVLEVVGAKVGVSDRDESVKYIKGKTVKPDKWDDNRWDECSHGIHFFLTRIEAESYVL